MDKIRFHLTFPFYHFAPAFTTKQSHIMKPSFFFPPSDAYYNANNTSSFLPPKQLIHFLWVYVSEPSFKRWSLGWKKRKKKVPIYLYSPHKQKIKKKNLDYIRVTAQIRRTFCNDNQLFSLSFTLIFVRSTYVMDTSPQCLPVHNLHPFCYILFTIERTIRR